MITKQDINQSILDTFHGMEDDVEYVLNQESFQDYFQARVAVGYNAIKREHCRLKRTKQKLMASSNDGKSYHHSFDFSVKHNDLTLALAFAFAGFAFAFAFAFAAFALQTNGIEKLKTDPCEGKIVEIEGKKYRLTLLA